MKRNILHLLAFSMLLGLSALSEVRAQEFQSNETNGYLFQEPNPYDEKPLIMESELKSSKVFVRDSSSQGRSTPNATSAKKSVTSTDAKKSTPSGKTDDALNHNFLYYIIQKFKTSDLIEQ